MQHRRVFERFEATSAIRRETTLHGRVRVTIRCPRIQVSASAEFVEAVEGLLGRDTVHLLPPLRPGRRVETAASPAAPLPDATARRMQGAPAH